MGCRQGYARFSLSALDAARFDTSYIFISLRRHFAAATVRTGHFADFINMPYIFAHARQHIDAEPFMLLRFSLDFAEEERCFDFYIYITGMPDYRHFVYSKQARSRHYFSPIMGRD